MRRTLLAFISLIAAIILDSSVSQAKIYIDLSAPEAKTVPVALPELRYAGAAPSTPEESARVNSIKAELMDAIRSDLKFTGFFTIIDEKAYIEDPSAEKVNFRDWRAAGADNLIKGSFSLEKDGRVTVEARFYDCVGEKELVGKKYSGSAANPRKIAHYFMDHLYQELTGKKGVFTSKILFVSDKTGKKEIYVADFDGRNATQVTRNRTINLSPQWSPDGKRIIYISYKSGSPSLFMLDLPTGKDTVLSSRKGINIGGRFSPDGEKIALTLSGKKSPELFLMDIKGNILKQLTDNHGIDVSPAWSPDGTKLAFVSDSAGNPHIFVLDLLTGDVKRVTFSGKYNSSPAWSPDGKRLAYSRADSGRFNIWIMQADGSSPAQLTFEGNNRNPSWSPDGRYIIYSSMTREGSSLYMMQSDGTGVTKVTTGVGNEKAPAWSPYLQ